MKQKASGGKKHRKWERNKASCLYYRQTHRRERNKIKKLLKHLAKFSNDHVAIEALKIARVVL